jgi:DNA polymerase (family 10)
MYATESQPAIGRRHAPMKEQDRKYIADQLLLTADLLELWTGSDVEPNLYRQGATLLRQPQDLPANATSMDAIAVLENVSADVLLDAHSLLGSGDTELLVRLRERIPASVRALLPLNGLGAKRLRVVWREMGITDLASLGLAVAENRLLKATGFGPKTQEKVRQSIAAARLRGDCFAYSDLRPIATVLEHELRELLGADARLDFTGEYRRGCTTCNGIEMIADPDHYKAILLHMIQCEGYEIMTAGSDMVAARVRDTDIPLTFHFKSINYYLELFRTTGSAEHVALIPVDERKRYKSEAEIYADAGLPYIPTALREGKAEIKRALQKGLPKLVHHTDIMGLLHAHSTYSDGSDSLEAMALHCKAMGMHYLGISDHGPHHVHGMGMRLESIRLQHKEIDRLNQQLAPFVILKGIELDIQHDGSLGMADMELANFDFVIASLHEDQLLTTSDATIRLVRAIRNPYTTILGHATGRLLFGQSGQPINLEAVLEACAMHDVAIELNCNPSRMDLDWEGIRLAAAMDVRVAINPDAHSAAGLHDYENGIAVARKGMLPPSKTLNALPLDQIHQFLMAKRAQRIL